MRRRERKKERKKKTAAATLPFIFQAAKKHRTHTHTHTEEKRKERKKNEKKIRSWKKGRKQVKYKAFGGILSFFFSVVGKSQMKKEWRSKCEGERRETIPFGTRSSSSLSPPNQVRTLIGSPFKLPIAIRSPASYSVFVCKACLNLSRNAKASSLLLSRLYLLLWTKRGKEGERERFPSFDPSPSSPMRHDTIRPPKKHLPLAHTQMCHHESRIRVQQPFMAHPSTPTLASNVLLEHASKCSPLPSKSLI